MKQFSSIITDHLRKIEERSRNDLRRAVNGQRVSFTIIKISISYHKNNKITH